MPCSIPSARPSARYSSCHAHTRCGGPQAVRAGLAAGADALFAGEGRLLLDTLRVGVEDSSDDNAVAGEARSVGAPFQDLHHCAGCDDAGACLVSLRAVSQWLQPTRPRTGHGEHLRVAGGTAQCSASPRPRTSFAGASALLRELAGLAVAPETVERYAEALGREIADDEVRVIDPEPCNASTLYLGLDGIRTAAAGEARPACA